MGIGLGLGLGLGRGLGRGIIRLRGKLMEMRVARMAWLAFKPGAGWSWLRSLSLGGKAYRFTICFDLKMEPTI